MKVIQFFQHPANRTLLSIAIIGLFIGFLFSQLFAVDEKEKAQPEKKEKARIYQVGASIGQEALTSTRVFSPLPLAGALSQEFGDEVQAATRLFSERQMVGRYEGKMFTEQAVFRADAFFFDVFDYDVVKGNAASALLASHAAVMTESCATRYFGNDMQANIGKTFTLDHQTYELKAIVDDKANDAPLEFDMLLSLASLTPLENSQDWSWNIVDTYLRLDEDACAQHLLAKLPLVVEKYARPQLGSSFDKWRSQGGQPRYFLEAV
jgi:putative ABC transport system permease protein